MSDADKQALRNGTAAIRCKLIVLAKGTLPQIELTEDNAVKSWDYDDNRIVPNKGFIGQFVSRTLSGELQNISDDFDINDREIELKIGIVRMNDNTTTWYSYGNFLVVDPDDDEVKDNTHFECMDYTKKFNASFNGDYTDEEFTESYNDKMGLNTTDGETVGVEAVTALWLARYTCKQIGVELATLNFRNASFAISQNPFQAGESCRDVMKAIGKLAFSWVRIGWDNKCYIDFNKKSTETLDPLNIYDNNQYFSLRTKSVVGPINKIVVGMEGIDGESAIITDPASIEQYGEHALYIYDNPLTWTFSLREQSLQAASDLFGLTYTQLNTETIGHPWLTGTELISVLDMENNPTYTYPFNKKIKYSGHIRSIIDSMDDTEINETLGYTSDTLRGIRNASINVDKQNGEIRSLTTRVESMDTTVENNRQELLNKFGEYLPKSEMVDFTTTLEEIQTDTYKKTEIQKIVSGVGVDGVKVTAVISNSGTFDDDGMTYERSGAKTKTTINEVGVNVKDSSGNSVQFSGYVNEQNTDYPDYIGQTIVGTENIVVKKYLNIGNHSRIQDYGNGTGIFYRGGF